MIAAGTGLAVGGSADNAALEASLEAIERSGAARADLAVVFVTGGARTRAHEALHAVRRVTGAPVVLGCSGTGILTERREVEDDLAVAVLAVRCERLVATDPGRDLWNPAGSPNARFVAASRGDDQTSGPIAIFSSASGRPVRTLTKGPNDALPSWSRDGKSIAFSRGRSIWTVGTGR